MEQHPGIAGDFTNAGDIIDCTDLVIGMHDADQNRIFTQGSRDRLRCDQTIAARIQIGDFKALAFQLATGVQYGFVLDL